VLAELRAIAVAAARQLDRPMTVADLISGAGDRRNGSAADRCCEPHAPGTAIARTDITGAVIRS